MCSRHGANACGNARKHPQEERASSPAQKSKATQNGKDKLSDKKDETSVDRRNKPHVAGEIVPIRFVVTGALPCVRATFHKQGADMVEIVSFFRHVELDEKHNKKSKKYRAEGSVAMASEEVYSVGRRTKRN